MVYIYGKALIGNVHGFGDVHKNLRPESMIGFGITSGVQSPAIYLTGFEYFRRDWDKGTAWG